MDTSSPSASASRAPVRTGRLVAGALLVLFGVGWLLEVLDVVDFAWDLLLPGALVLVGVALFVTAGSATAHGGLIATGVVLTGVLAVGSAIDFPVGGGVGERVEHPTGVAALREEFGLGIGRLTVDLRDLPLERIAAAQQVRAHVGIGQLVLVVPPGTPVRVVARAALGNVHVFDVEGSGFDVERATAPAGEPVLEMVLSVGVGQVEVRRG